MKIRVRKMFFILLLNLVLVLEMYSCRMTQDLRTSIMREEKRAFLYYVTKFVNAAEAKIRQDSFNEHDIIMLLYFINQLSTRKRQISTPPVYWYSRMGWKNIRLFFKWNCLRKSPIWKIRLFHIDFSESPYQI